jgi:hypothetical protein
MRRDTPIHTFWAIIGMTLVALGITRYYAIPGDQAMPLFVLFMLLGVPLGEILERWDEKRNL